MILYIILTVFILLVALFSTSQWIYSPLVGNRTVVSFAQAFLSMAPIIFFIGLRSAGADTEAYILMFESLPVGIDEILHVLSNHQGEFTFDVLGIVIKTYISSDFHVYLFIIALISGWCIAKTLRSYSAFFTLSMLLFMLSGTFTWMINGIRQFLVASIAFAFFPILLRKHYIAYFILILFLSTIHTSSIILISALFLATGEPWNKRTLFVILLSVLSIVFISNVVGLMSTALENTQYANATQQFASDDGMNPIRAFINSVPALLAFYYREKIKLIASPVINLCINMSILGASVSWIAVVTSGILIGRLPVYFTLYNLILLPWIILVCTEKYRLPVAAIALLSYIFYFFYNNFYVSHYYYYSEFLNIYLK